MQSMRLLKRLSIATGVLCLFGTLNTAAALASCNINVAVRNTGAHPITILSDTARIRMRVGVGPAAAPGPWRVLGNGGWFANNFTVDAGASRSRVYSADFGCNANRRVTLNYRCRGGANDGQIFSYYAPSSSGWTKDSNITLRLNRCS